MDGSLTNKIDENNNFFEKEKIFTVHHHGNRERSPPLNPAVSLVLCLFFSLKSLRNTLLT